MSKKTNTMGRASWNFPDKIAAGSWASGRLTFTAGEAGVDDTGGIRVCMRDICDCAMMQFTDPRAPNYVSATTSADADLICHYVGKGNTRPWSRTLYLKVIKGYLNPGDTVTVHFGDASQGSPGWRMQTFRQANLTAKVLVDAFATFVFQEVPVDGMSEIVAGKPVRLVAVAPSVVPPGETFEIRGRLEDDWGNALERTLTFSHKGLSEGVHRLEVRDGKTGLTAVTNPVWVSEGGSGVFWGDLHGQSEETIGSNSVEYYWEFARDKAFLDFASHQGNDFQVTDAFFRRLEKAASRTSQRNHFVAFPGYEWSGNTGVGGDHNVVFRKSGGFVTRSSRALVRDADCAHEDSPNATALFETLWKAFGEDALALGHVGGRYANLDFHHDQMKRAIEIHSAWGTFEWLLEDAFQRGQKVAVFANSDDHKARPGMSHPGGSGFGSFGGLTAVLCKSLERGAVWRALRQGRVFCTTGARMLLDFSCNLQYGPGDDVALEGPVKVQFSVHGTAPIAEVQLRNGMRTVKSWRPGTRRPESRRVLLFWAGAERRGRERPTRWEGVVRLRGNAMTRFDAVNFWNREMQPIQESKRRLSFVGITTGGLQGVVLELEKGCSGTIEFESNIKKFSLNLRDLKEKPFVRKAGGLARRVCVMRLPEEPANMDFECATEIRSLRKGSNPLFFRVMQEDGHLAWTSPLYLEER